MGLFGGESKSDSSQSTELVAQNSQGNQAPTFTSRGQGVSYAEAGGASLNRSIYAESGGLSVGSRSVINYANSDKLAEIAAEISTSALDYYDKQNERSLDLAERVATATTASNKDIISEFAAITEKSNQSEALTLNEQLLKYGVIGLIGFFIFQGVRSA